MRQIRVLVVDDSRFFREILEKGINSDRSLTVVAKAGDPYEARDAIIKYRPDVMVLDVEMPRMNGIEFLKKLMPQFPVATVMVSALDSKIFEALSAGAVDFVVKPKTNNQEQIEEFIKSELNTKIKIASTAKIGSFKQLAHQSAAAVSREGREYTDRIVAIGASTGGTEALARVISGFGPDIPGTVIVQHMPAGFTAMYAERLNNQSRVYVKEAKTGDILEPGVVLIAPGDAHLRVTKVNGVYRAECKKEERVSGHCPSVDVLFQSVAKAAGNKAIGVILTGMGADGARGLLEMRKAGAETIGQDEASCVVYGMPKVAYEIGAVRYQMGLDNIAGKIYNLLNTNKTI